MVFKIYLDENYSHTHALGLKSRPHLNLKFTFIYLVYTVTTNFDISMGFFWMTDFVAYAVSLFKTALDNTQVDIWVMHKYVYFV